MFAIVINEQGLKTTFVELHEDGTPKFYTLKDGESLILDRWRMANTMNKPMWNGTEWTDTEPLPQQEEVPQEPSWGDKISILKQENELLKAQVKANATNSEFLESCIMEMAQMVYA